MENVQMGENGQKTGASSSRSSRVCSFELELCDKPIQVFEEEEVEEVDQPLAPLQDVEEIETNEEDAETAEDIPTEENSRAVSELPQAKDATLSHPDTPKPHPLSVSFRPPSPTPAPQEQENIEVDTEVLTAITTLDPGLVEAVQELNADDIMHMGVTDLVPDSELLESAVDLLQVQEVADILGDAELMDQAGDLFQDAQ
jgi:hypothetical protein